LQDGIGHRAHEADFEGTAMLVRVVDSIADFLVQRPGDGRLVADGGNFVASFSATAAGLLVLRRQPIA
jgi:hypothetical protein